MNPKMDAPKNPLAEECEPEGRREAVRKLGKYAAYAAPFTLLAVNARAAQSGSGVGGRRPAARTAPQQ
jgi:hypothetical protein